MRNIQIRIERCGNRYISYICIKSAIGAEENENGWNRKEVKDWR